MPVDERAQEHPAQLGPFRIEGVLGEGGSGVVYSTEHHGQAAALKVPRPDRELTAKERDRFLEEAKMLQRVRHRAVVEVLDSGRLPSGAPYLLMRRYEGETLAARLERDGAIALERAIDLFSQLAAATSALHEAGLVHRDLKPENVFLVDGGKSAKLLDFGIAKDRDAPASTTTQAGVARGTPATMAPERFFGAPATVSSDVYELAVVLYAMLVGRLPWANVTNVDARLNPVSPRDAGAQVSDALGRVILQALSTRPERRPPSVAEFESRIIEALQTSSEASPRVTAETPTLPPPGETAPMSTHPEATSDGAVILGYRDALIRGASRRRVALVIGGLVLGLLVGLSGRWLLTRSPTTIQAEEHASSEGLPLTTPALDFSDRAGTALPSAPVVRPKLTTRVRKAPAADATVSPRPSSRPRTRPVAAAHTARGAATNSSGPSAKPAPSVAPAALGKPKGAPCSRSSECASMLCAAETCQ